MAAKKKDERRGHSLRVGGGVEVGCFVLVRNCWYYKCCAADHQKVMHRKKKRMVSGMRRIIQRDVNGVITLAS